MLSVPRVLSVLAPVTSALEGVGRGLEMLIPDRNLGCPLRGSFDTVASGRVSNRTHGGLAHERGEFCTRQPGETGCNCLQVHRFAEWLLPRLNSQDLLASLTIRNADLVLRFESSGSKESGVDRVSTIRRPQHDQIRIGGCRIQLCEEL